MDVRLKTFGAEVAGRFGFLVDDFGFTGPVVVRDDTSLTPVIVSYTSDAVSVSLLLAYMGEESVATRIVTRSSDGAPVWTSIGSNIAYKGHEMRKALDRQSLALRVHLERFGRG